MKSIRHISALLSAALVALIFSALHADAAPNRVCDYIVGSTTTASGFANCTEEIGDLATKSFAIVTSASGTNTITGTSSPAVTTLSGGQMVVFTAPNTITGPATFQLDSTSAASLYADDGTTALGSGDLVAGRRYLLSYRGDTGRWLVMGSLGSGSASVNAPYLTVGNVAAFTNERAITPDGTTITGTDGGANSTYTLSVTNNGISDAKLRQGAATSVIGRSANTTGNVADITASADGQYLRRSSSALSFGVPTATEITNTPAGNIAATTVQAALNEIDGEKQILDSDLTALAGNSTAGLWASTAVGSGAARTLTAPAAGITITNPAGTAGNPTFALANDLAGVEGLAANGIATRTATDTWAARTITGTANEITVTNGDGVSGNPTVSLPSAITLTGKTLTNGSFVTPALGTPSSINLTNGTALPVSGISGLGTGVGTALGVATNANGGIPIQGGTPTAGNCVRWKTGGGIEDAGATCGGGGGGGSPGGSSGQVQYNNAGAFGGYTNTQLAALTGEAHSTTYGTVADLNAVTGATSITSGTATLTVAGASFAPGDVGKVILVPGAGAAGVPLNTTILSYTSATQVTLAANASTTLSAVSKTIWYGTDNATALQNWLNDCQNLARTCVYDSQNLGINSALSITSGVKVIGGGGAGKGILFQFNMSASAFSINTTAAVQLSGLTLYSLDGITTGVNNSGINVTASTYNYGSSFTELNINGFATSFNATKASVVYFAHNTLNNMVTGLNLGNTNTPLAGVYFVHDNNIGCSFSSPASTYAAIQITSGGNLQLSNNVLHFCSYGLVAAPTTTVQLGDLYMSNNTFEQNSTTNVYLNASAASSNINSVTITGGDMAGGTPNCIWVGATGSDVILDVSITGVNCDPNSAGGAAYGVAVKGGVSGLSIVGNTFANGGGSSSTAISVDAGAIGIASGNNFRNMNVNISDNTTGTFVFDRPLNEIRLTANYTLISQTAAQKLFNSTTNGAFNAEANMTYRLQCNIAAASLSASSGSFGFALGGTATFTQTWSAIAKKGTLATAATPSMTWNTAANTTLVAANTSTTAQLLVDGSLRTTGAGTIIPQISLGVANAAVVQAGSYCNFKPYNSNTAVAVGSFQ